MKKFLIFILFPLFNLQPYSITQHPSWKEKFTSLEPCKINVLLRGEGSLVREFNCGIQNVYLDWDEVSLPTFITIHKLKSPQKTMDYYIAALWQKDNEKLWNRCTVYFSIETDHLSKNLTYKCAHILKVFSEKRIYFIWKYLDTYIKEMGGEFY